MEVIIEASTVEPANILRNGGLLVLLFPLKLLKCVLNLVSPALLLVCSDDFLSCFKILTDSFVEVNGKLLIMLRYLLAEITASGMYHKIE